MSPRINVRAYGLGGFLAILLFVYLTSGCTGMGTIKGAVDLDGDGDDDIIVDTSVAKPIEEPEKDSSSGAASNDRMGEPNVEEEENEELAL